MRKMKFVAHDSTIAHDLVCNQVLYTRAWRVIVHTHSNKDLVEEARGFIIQLKDEIWVLDVFLLVAVTRILKRFSSQFQVSTLRLEGYFNLIGQFKEALENLKIASHNAASAFYLQEYTEQLTTPLLVDPAERTSRQRPTVGPDTVE